MIRNGSFFCRSLCSLSLAIVLIVLGTTTATAQQVVSKKAVFEEDNEYLMVSAGFREMFDMKLRQKLISGFATTVVMRIFLYEKEEANPVSVSARTLSAVYDLWDEHYSVKFEEPGRTFYRRFKDQQQVVNRLTSFWKLPISPIAKIERQKEYIVSAVVEINPMRAEVLGEVRRWLRTPYRRHSQMGGESFFGSFVSIFVNNKIRRAEKTFKVRTLPFSRHP
ncbi:MAG: hypothetical protein V1754_14345 [Pseudomonadota bacterium]